MRRVLLAISGSLILAGCGSTSTKSASRSHSALHTRTSTVAPPSLSQEAAEYLEENYALRPGTVRCVVGASRDRLPKFHCKGSNEVGEATTYLVVKEGGNKGFEKDGYEAYAINHAGAKATP